MKELVNTSNVPIYLCKTPTDMRLGLPGLARKIEQEANKDPYRKGIYVFVSNDFKRIKLFYYDRNGFVMWYKKIDKGAFRLKWTNGYRTIDAINLKALLGISQRRIDK